MVIRIIKSSVAAYLALAIILANIPALAQEGESSSFETGDRKVPATGGDVGSDEETMRRNGVDMVFLVDISKSMDDIFADVQDSLAEYVEKAMIGDRVVVISFGEETCLEVKRCIKSAQDKTSVIESIRRMTPKDYSTYIVAAVERALNEFVRLKDEGSTNVRYLFLITDGKNNPPKHISYPLTFDEILRRYKSLKPGQDWFMFYITIGNVNDTETKQFAEKVGGGIYNTEEASLAACLSSTRIPLPARILAVYDRAEIRQQGCDSWITIEPGMSVRRGDCVKTGLEGRAVLDFHGYGKIGIDHDTEMQLTNASMNPVSDSVDISIRLIRGKLTNVLEELPGYSSNFEIVTPHIVPQAKISNL